MALRHLLRHLLTPLKLSLFLLISLPLAIFAAITTFISVILLSSRILLVYFDLITSVIIAPPPHHHTHKPVVTKVSTKLVIPTSGRMRQQSVTAPSSPNIGRKRVPFYIGGGSPPLSMKVGKVYEGRRRVRSEDGEGEEDYFVGRR
ncbi:hypothetical protein TWF481_005921 [Arthrobotrys musiformis]|uniref:Transmembrane protein n=1 Tax=Arthrobotrys musiformis TaxID=47236 RepID=A0AAV9WH99_9PEZI